MNDTTKLNYCFHEDSITGFVLDTLLRRLNLCYIDFEKKIFIGSKTTRINPELTPIDNHEYLGGKPTLVRQVQCIHASQYS